MNIKSNKDYNKELIKSYEQGKPEDKWTKKQVDEMAIVAIVIAFAVAMMFVAMQYAPAYNV